MNREYYCKVRSDAELRDMVENLKEIEEPVFEYILCYITIPERNSWCWLGYKQSYGEWNLFQEEPEGILVDSEDLIDKVVGNKIPRFEKDTWYEIKYYFGKKLCNIIMKSTNNSKNEIYFTEYYDLIDQEWTKASRFSIDASINLIYYKELTLSEIQQYLPNRHPDKIKEFVLPKRWCIKVQENNCPGIVREWRQYPLQNNGDWLDSGYICGDTGYHTYSTENFPKGYTEITLDQFKKYVLKEKEGKLDKQTQIKEDVKEEFKIGDWITITESDDNWSSDMDKYIGKTVQITGYRSPNGTTFKESGSWYWCYEQKHFRRATKEEIASVTKSEETFEIGDWVTIKDRQTLKCGCKGCPEGTWQIVEEPADSGLYEQDGGFVVSTANGNWRISNVGVRKARPDEIKDKVETYNNGDWVVVLMAEGSSNEDGDVGVVKESSGTSFRVHVPGKTNLSNWTSARNVRRAFPSEIPYQDAYICGIDPGYTLDEPKSLLDREEIEVTIKKTVPKQFNIF